MQSELNVFLEPGLEPTIVFVHGVLDKGASFRGVAKYLSDYQLLFYDRRGYNKSRKVFRLERSGILGNFEDLLEITRDLPSILLVGHSYGATLCLYAAIKGLPNLKGVVAFEPPLPFLEEWGGAPSSFLKLTDNESEAVDKFLIGMLGQDQFLNLPERIKNIKRKEGKALLSDLVDLRSRSKDFDFRKINVKVLLALSEFGNERHKIAAKLISKDIRDVQVKTLQNANHNAHVNDPKGFSELILDFLAEIKQPNIN